MKTVNQTTPKIKTICGAVLRESVRDGGCGNCRASCQSACKTSCTVANQSCERTGK
ncbi:MAG: six-cysteine ranthipeptide SCIFF [Oscillospiraceae bacterium]|nr:six-cysteine ranthipeptide SCIFF [Oscillospiraceae bacterium]